MKTAEQRLIEEEIMQGLERLRPKLQDSPISFGNYKYQQRGFYYGFCYAKNWDTDIDFVDKIDRMELIIK